MRKREFWVVVAALLVSSCFAAPHVPNDDLTQACRESANWRRQTVTANVVLTADFVNLTLSAPLWSETAGEGLGVQPGYDPCARCTALLLQGFASVEYLPNRAPTLDRVWRYSLANDGDPRCRVIEHPHVDDPLPPGKCVAVEKDVPRTARFAVTTFDTDHIVHSARLETWNYFAIDLSNRQVLARAREFYQTGWETPAYSCRDVHIDRGEMGAGEDFIEQSIRPSGSTPRQPVNTP